MPQKVVSGEERLFTKPSAGHWLLTYDSKVPGKIHRGLFSGRHSVKSLGSRVRPNWSLIKCHFSEMPFLSPPNKPCPVTLSLFLLSTYQTFEDIFFPYCYHVVLYCIFILCVYHLSLPLNKLHEEKTLRWSDLTLSSLSYRSFPDEPTSTWKVPEIKMAGFLSMS